MVEKDLKAFWEADAATHLELAYNYYGNPKARYPMYEIRRDYVLEMLDKLQPGCLLDGGCGAGYIVVEGLNRGWDAVGIDFAESMVKLAHNYLREQGHDPFRVKIGSVADMSAFGDSSFDVITLLGVSQYFPADEDNRIWREVHRVLKPQGYVIIDFVNALFDLLTFNRFTIRFVTDEVLRKFFPPERIPELERRVAGLVTHPDKPDTTGLYATRRDHVTKRTENPLTVAQRMREHGFAVADLLFYRFHAVPPLLFEQEPELEKIAIAKERELSHHWIGHFMASAFITMLTKE